jgi:hypothetical protein
LQSVAIWRRALAKSLLLLVYLLVHFGIISAVATGDDLLETIFVLAHNL